MNVLGGVQLSVDGVAVEPANALTYKGTMLSDVPNLALAGGYANASWTLKCDLTAEYVCRLLAHMNKTGLRQCTPRNRDGSIRRVPVFDFSSSYVVRALHKLPKQGTKLPWRMHQNYARDLIALRYGRLVDGVLQFTNPLGAPHDDASSGVSSLPPRRRGQPGDYDQPALRVAAPPAE
jgi:monooxygenase